MQMVNSPITRHELAQIAAGRFGNMTKAVVDVEKKIMVVDADLHADQEKYLLRSGSQQHNLWGINLYPQEDGPEGLIEFDSMINLRPSNNNYSRSVDDAQIRAKIIAVVHQLISD